MFKLWHLRSAKRENEEPIWTYGIATCRYHVPGVICPKCGPRGGGHLHPVPCPLHIGKEMEAVYAENSCRPFNEFMHYRKRWEVAFKRTGINLTIEPGDDFLPVVWDVPTRPRLSIFWPCFHIIVSEKTANLFLENAISGVVIHPVVLRSAGSLEATYPIPTPVLNECNEPEDLINVAPRLSEQSRHGTYFSLHVLSDSFYSWMDDIKGKVNLCSVCGRQTIPKELEIDRNKVRSYWRKRIQLPEKYSFPVDIFRSHIYNDGLLVSERVMSLLDANDLRSCRVQEIAVVSDSE